MLYWFYGLIIEKNMMLRVIYGFDLFLLFSYLGKRFGFNVLIF